jgi:hypothetical protein
VITLTLSTGSFIPSATLLWTANGDWVDAQMVTLPFSIVARLV